MIIYSSEELTKAVRLEGQPVFELAISGCNSYYQKLPNQNILLTLNRNQVAHISPSQLGLIIDAFRRQDSMAFSWKEVTEDAIRTPRDSDDCTHYICTSRELCVYQGTATNKVAKIKKELIFNLLATLALTEELNDYLTIPMLELRATETLLSLNTLYTYSSWNIINTMSGLKIFNKRVLDFIESVPTLDENKITNLSSFTAKGVELQDGFFGSKTHYSRQSWAPARSQLTIAHAHRKSLIALEYLFEIDGGSPIDLREEVPTELPSIIYEDKQTLYGLTENIYTTKEVSETLAFALTESIGKQYGRSSNCSINSSILNHFEKLIHTKGETPLTKLIDRVNEKIGVDLNPMDLHSTLQHVLYIENQNAKEVNLKGNVLEELPIESYFPVNAYFKYNEASIIYLTLNNGIFLDGNYYTKTTMVNLETLTELIKLNDGANFHSNIVPFEPSIMDSTLERLVLYNDDSTFELLDTPHGLEYRFKF